MLSVSYFCKMIIFLTIWLLFVILLRNSLRREYKFMNKFIYRMKDEIKLDRSEPLNDTALLSALGRELPNVPFDYWYENRHNKLQVNGTCGKFATPLQLDYHNNYWQTLHNGNITFRLLSAHFDNRPIVGPSPFVRLLSLNTARHKFETTYYCQLWYDNRTSPIIVPVAEFKYMWRVEWTATELFQPYLLSCMPPTELSATVPRVVSLVTRPCDMATNSLKVHYNVPRSPAKKETIAVCAKGLHFPYVDFSARFVEWMEMLRLLGVHRVHAYELGVPENMTKVLRHYQEEGYLQLLPHTMHKGAPQLRYVQSLALKTVLLPHMLDEVVLYTDCFYRHMYEYDYIALIDVDEVILPQGEMRTWQQLLQSVATLPTEMRAQSQPPDGYTGVCFRNLMYPSDAPVLPEAKAQVPDYMHMLQHTMRFVNFTGPGDSIKCFHNTSNILTLHNHYPINCIPSCQALDFHTSLGRLQHYRYWYRAPKVIEHVLDDSIWRYKEPLMGAVNTILRKLNFLRTE